MTAPITVVPMPRPAAPVPQGAGLTHRGRVRDRNEDSILTDPSGVLWAVADGMGGYGHGDVASDLVIDSLAALTDDTDPAAALIRHLGLANDLVRARAAEVGQMGATVVAAIVQRAMAHVVWAGDCRAYLMRGGRLRLLTRDHSLVQDLIERGEITEAEAATHPESHVVTRAIGGTPSLEAESVSVPLLVGDRVLMCSDGLPRCVYDGTIAAILAQAATPSEACEALVREALEAGAPDNVSVIVIDMGQG